MKINNKITITIACYLISIIGLYTSAKFFINNKDERLRREAHENLDNFFAKQKMFINVEYSGKKVAYKQIKIPKFTESIYNANIDKEEWGDLYGDKYKLYQLIPKYKSENAWNNDNEWSGWLLSVIEEDAYGFSEYLVYPYQVGYKKQENSFFYNYEPSVQQSIDNSFEFHTENKKSSYINYICKDRKISRFEVMDSVENEYYILFSYDNYVSIFGKNATDSIISTEMFSKSNLTTLVKAEGRYSGYIGGMSDGYCQVYNHLEPLRYWQIIYNFRNDPKEKDFKMITLWGTIILTLLFLILVVPMLIIKNKNKKINNESLKEKLIRLCNPKNYTNPYDKEKIDKANIIYQTLIKTNNDDFENLKELRKKAINELSIEFVNKEKIRELKDKTNPKKFMKPYNPEKITLANSLYSQLTNPEITPEELDEIEVKIQDLHKQ